MLVFYSVLSEVWAWENNINQTQRPGLKKKKKRLEVLLPMSTLGPSFLMEMLLFAIQIPPAFLTQGDPTTSPVYGGELGPALLSVYTVRSSPYATFKAGKMTRRQNGWETWRSGELGAGPPYQEKWLLQNSIAMPAAAGPRLLLAPPWLHSFETLT